LRARLEKVFTRNGVKKDKKQASKARLDDNILECFSTLSAQCRDEELEDLAYFILDLYQLNGVQVALAEIDVTQV
jgi:separase